MKKIIIGVLVVTVFAVGVLVGCSSNSSSAGNEAATETTLAEGAKSLEGKKVYIVTPSSGFAITGDEVITKLEEVTDEDSAPFLKVAHNGSEVVDEKSGVTFVVSSEVTPSDEIVVYDIDGMSVEELQSLYLDTFTKEVGEFESSYGKCYVVRQ